MAPWYKVATPRKEVRQGRSFKPDEFAIHLEQIIARTADTSVVQRFETDLKQILNDLCLWGKLKLETR